MIETQGMSEAAKEQAEALGREMAERDTWIRPLDDLNRDNFDPDNYGEFLEATIEGWSETCQWEILWDKQLDELAETDAEAQGVYRSADWEHWYYEFYSPMKQAMWEAWAEHKNINLVDFWKEHYQ